MDEDTQDKSPEQSSSAPSGGVMDVKPPETSTPGVPPFGISDEPAQKHVGDGAVATPPETKDAKPAEPIGPVDSPHDTPADDYPQPPPHIEHKSHPPIVAIIVAVVIALALVGVTVFAYMSSKNDTKHEGDDHEMTEQQSSQQSAATTTDVDDTSKEVDSTLGSVDENKDFPESELTDQALGL
jgi:uncharacterized protein HemX